MRTPKSRRVCLLPKCRRFRSVEDPDSTVERASVTLSVTEFEAVRLVDYVGLTQEEAARQMNVARTTVQRLYKSARQKLATFVVEGLCLNIEGGNYELCERDRKTCRKECRFGDRGRHCPARRDEIGDGETVQNETPDADPL